MARFCARHVYLFMAVARTPSIRSCAWRTRPAIASICAPPSYCTTGPSCRSVVLMAAGSMTSRSAHGEVSRSSTPSHLLNHCITTAATLTQLCAVDGPIVSPAPRNFSTASLPSKLETSNYPITASLAFALCGHALGEHRYLDRARALAHTSLDYFTPNGLLFGEGHPLREVTPKGCHPVDLGYNVEESLPALAHYSLLTNDQQVLEQTVKSLRAHMEFMLPNGA